MESILNSKFDKVPVEHDTKVLCHREAKLGDCEVLYQMWVWDGYYGESFIFASDDIANLDDEQIELEVRKSPLIKQNSSLTINRSESGFTFVNFNSE